MSGDLKFNKVLGAVLATAFVIIGVREGTNILFATEAPEKMGYFVDAPEEAAATAEAPVLPPDWGTVLPTADMAAGEAAFAACKGCHSVAAGGANGIGPALYGVIGRTPGVQAGFAYSDAMKGHAAVDPNWSLDAMDKFLAAPQRYVSGTKMSYAGIRNAETRVNLIAWLRTQGSTGVAIPAPDPSRQPGAAPAAGAEAAPAAPGGDTAAAAAGGQAGGAPTTGAAAQPATETSPIAPPAPATGTGPAR